MPRSLHPADGTPPITAQESAPAKWDVHVLVPGDLGNSSQVKDTIEHYGILRDDRQAVFAGKVGKHLTAGERFRAARDYERLEKDPKRPRRRLGVSNLAYWYAVTPKTLRTAWRWLFVICMMWHKN